MSFNSNTWYSIQNFGNDYFLGCQNVGNCSTGNAGLADAELFQIAALNSGQSYYVRPKSHKSSSSGESYCVNINTGWPTITTCNNQSASWGIGNWTADNAAEGRFFFNIQRGDSQRLSLSNDLNYSLVNYTGLSQSNIVLMQWGVTSRAVVNDQSYSTVPAGITGAAISVTASSASSASSASANPTSTSISSGSSGVTSSTILSTVSGASTVTTIITPTVTASPVSSTISTASTTSSPTVVGANSADRALVGVKQVLMLTLVLPHVFAFLF